MPLDRRLILFATSERPDPYINAICYGVMHKGIKSIEVVVMTDHAYAGPDQSKERAHLVLSRILGHLQGLSEGNYQISRAGPVQAYEPLNSPSANETYKHVLDLINRGGVSAKTISINELFIQLRRWGTTKSVLIDVTALQKNLLVDVVSSALLLDFAEVYSFELQKPHVTHGQEDLFHNLRPELDFTYRNLLQSAPVAQANRRIKRWRLQLWAYAISAVLVFAMPLALGKVWSADKVVANVGYFSSLVTIATALLPFVREKFK